VAPAGGELRRGWMLVERGVRRSGRCDALYMYRGTSLIRTRTLLGPYRRLMPRVIKGS